MHIPSIEQIKACTNLISLPDASAKVVKIDESIVVKYGGSVSPIEGETLQYLNKNPRLPVPKVLASFTEPETKINFVVMEYIPGDTLERVMSDLSPDEKAQVETQIREAMQELRGLPSEGYVGSVGRKACEDSCFYNFDNNPKISGPFDTAEEMFEALAERLKETQKPEHIALLKRMMQKTLTKSKGVNFTHGDLQAKNIMVNRNAGENGGKRIKVTIIDWETSGWYPEYWEFFTAARSARWRSDEWLGMLTRILDIYEVEYAVMQMVWSILFW